MSTVGYRSAAAHLEDELARADLLLRSAVALHVAGLAGDTDSLRWGLSEVTPGEVATYLSAPPPPARPDFDDDPRAAGFRAKAATRRCEIDNRLAASRPGLALPLSNLVARFGLDATARDAILLLALAERHETYRRIVAYLHDNGARPWFSPALLAWVLGLGPHTGLLAPGGPLLETGLVRADEDGRQIRLDPRVAAFLEGEPACPPEIARLTVDPAQVAAPAECLEEGLARQLAALLAAGGTAMVVGPAGSLRGALAVRAVTDAGEVPLCISGPRLAAEPDAARRLRLASREATLTGRVLLMLDTDLLAEIPAVFAVLDAHGGPLILTGTTPAALGDRTSAVLEVAQSATLAVAAMWRGVLVEAGLPADGATSLAQAFPLAPIRARSAVRRAVLNARLAGKDTATAADVARACRSGAGTGSAGPTLTRFAQRIEPRPEARFDDLVLPPLPRRQIEEIRHRLKIGRALFEEVEFDRKMRLGRGFVALFTGPSGTGKTMAAELMARERGIDLYKVNLGQLVSKWVGETEKHIARIFAEARSLSAVLFFDECDALFGKRGDIKEARDRWANLEVNHLLVELEAHDGVVILATNLRRNLDEAFLRRIHAVVEFPAPDARCRLEIWRRVFPAGVRPPEDADLRLVAEALDLTGGLIRNIALDAVLRAHHEERRGADGRIEVPLSAIVVAAGREYRKLDRPLRASTYPAAWRDWLETDLADKRAG